MSLSVRLTNAVASLAADTVLAQLDGGYLRLWSGTQPATADTPITDQIQLAELRFNTPAFAAAVNGVAAANAITADTSADATGTAAWFRAYAADGTTVVCDGSVGTSGADMNLNSVAISAGANVSLSSFTYTQSKTA